MRDSGVEWIGEIPEGWTLRRLKDCIEICNGRETESDEGDVPVYGSGGSFKQTNRVLCATSSVLFGRKGTIDRPLFVNGGFWTVDTMFYSKHKDSSTDLKYIYYTALCFDFDYYKSGSTLPSMTQTDLGGIFVPHPNLSEQRKIVACLENKTSSFDVAISTLTNQLDVLRRYRASLIHEAVTKGLDPSVPMRPSGVKWIGDIPCHWDIVRVKHVAAISSGATPSRSFPEYWDGNIPWVKTGELANKPIHDTEEKITASGFTSSALTMYEPGTILVAMYGQGKTRGMTGLLTIPATTNQACAALVVDKEKMLADYLWVALMAAYGPIRVAAAGGAQPNLSQDLISNFAITWPPKAEQDRIARLVTSRSESIDSIIDLKERQLDVLKRRRQSLIYEYVTGKRRVK